MKKLSLLHFPKKTRQLLYGEWIKRKRPGLLSDFHKYLIKVDPQKCRSLYKSDGYWRGENLKGEWKNAYIYYWDDEDGFFPYKLTIEIDGRQHVTFDCHEAEGVFKTLCYFMTNHLSADYNKKNLDDDFRKGFIKRSKLTALNLETYGDCFVCIFNHPSQNNTTHHNTIFHN